MITRDGHETINAAGRKNGIGLNARVISVKIHAEVGCLIEIAERRTVIMVTELASPSMIPALTERWLPAFRLDHVGVQTLYAHVLNPGTACGTGGEKSTNFTQT
jgi:hypothetical protein